MTTYDPVDVANVYAATFAGRLDAFSPWIDTSDGGQWIAKREPLTAEVVIAAFRTKRPVGGYLLAADSTTHLACLDVDLEDGLMVADQVARAMKRTGLPAYVEPSRRGAHLWCVLDRPLPAIVVRRALRALLQAADVEPDPKIELRPGQDQLSSADGLGNALRLPLMPHQTTGVAGEWLAPGGVIVATRISEMLLNLEWASAPILAEWAEKYAPPLDPRAIPHAYRKPRAYKDSDDTSVIALLAEAGVARAVPGRAVKCPFHDDHHPSLSIARDERRVFCKSPECEAHNGGRGLGSIQLRNLIQRRGRAA